MEVSWLERNIIGEVETYTKKFSSFSEAERFATGALPADSIIPNSIEVFDEEGQCYNVRLTLFKTTYKRS